MTKQQADRGSWWGLARLDCPHSQVDSLQHTELLWNVFVCMAGSAMSGDGL